MSHREAELLKEEGNKCFRDKHYFKAIDFYTKSLNIEVSSNVLGNRAQALLNLHRWADAIMDCNRALEINPMLDKALYRRAIALEGMGLKASARRDLERCIAIAPNAAAEAIIKRLANQRDAELVRVKHVEKGDEIRSTAEMVEIDVDVIDPNEQSEVQDSIDAVSDFTSLSVDEVEIPPPALTYTQFVSHFSLLQKVPTMFAKYFLSIPSSSYSSLFDDLIEADVVSCLLRGLSSLVLSDTLVCESVEDCLLRLTIISRFELICLFLTVDDKKMTVMLISTTLVILSFFGLLLPATTLIRCRNCHDSMGNEEEEEWVNLVKLMCGLDCVGDLCYVSEYYYGESDHVFRHRGCIVGVVPSIGCRINQDGQTMCFCE
uniref:RNA polymerase II-associated protein 3 n=1 Tax=Heterorhabditis bacteriophora TaxID=37862 RepID=A0A1I7XCX5_HETBA